MPKKDNPGGGGGSGGGGSDVAFVVTGLNEEGDAIEGTCDAPPGTGITVIVTSVDSTTSWVSKAGVNTTVDENGNWSISLADLVVTGTDNDLSSESGKFTVVATYERNGKGKTVSTEETPLFLPGDNSPPVAVDDLYTVDEDASVTLNPLALDTDLDGDTLSIVSINGVVLTGAAQTIDTANGTVSIDAEGVITFAPAENFNGDTSFAYVISDGNGGTATANEVIAVTPVNDAPLINVTDSTLAGSVTEIADGAAGENAADLMASGTIAFSDTDVQDTHTASFVAQGANYRGIFSLGDPTTTETTSDGTTGWSLSVNDADLDDLAAGEVLIQSYDVTIDDGKGGMTTETVSVTITGASDTQVTAALTSFSYSGEDTGIDGDQITSDRTATFQISFNEWVAPGDMIALVVNDTADASVILTQAHVDAGFVELATTTDALFEGQNAVYANLSTGTDSAPIVLTLDTTTPAITGASALVLDENQTQTAMFNFDSDEIIAIWSIAGADANLFQIDSEGLLSFKDAPDFETPADNGENNVYNVTIEAVDRAGNTSTRDLAVTVANVVEAAPPTAYTNFVVFGDSLSDNGNFSDLAAGFFVRDEDGELIYTVPFQYDGGDGSVRTYDTRSFTDGTTYADTLAGRLSLDAAYENYAFGGAEALGSKLGSGYINEYSNLTTTGGVPFSIIEDTEAALAAYGNFDINLTAQVTRFIADNPDGAPDGTLAVLNIGGNDLSNFDTSFWNILFGGVNDFAADLGVQIETQARRLVTEAGVSGIALYTLPVADFFVGSDELSWLEAPVAEDLLNSVNDEILYRGQLLNTDPSLAITAEVIRLDIMSEELLADMQTHGFLYKGPYLQGYSGDPLWVETSSGVIEPVFIVNTAATAYRAEQILFFDEIHPSGALHDMLAVFSSESLSTGQVFGSGGADILTMTAADDFVLARGGNDEINLGAGDDVALGGTGDDTLRGEDGSDLLIGGAGSDSLEGGGGSDLLAGSAGNDQLSGGAEADLLIGGLGSDVVLGEAGDDVFIFFEEALWGGNGGSIDFYDGGDGENDTLLVFLLSDPESVAQEVTGTTTTLSFGDTSTLTAVNIEAIVLHMGLPADADSPLTTLALSMSDDLLARYEEGELWGIV